MKIDFQHLVSNWKSTAQAILTTTFAITGALMVSNVISPKTAAILGAINAVSKILVGVFQTDGIQLPPNSKLKQTTEIETPGDVK